MTFSTYGPFNLSELSNVGIDKLYEEFEEAQHALENAIGVYIIASKAGKHGLVPHYVGKTNKGFGKRLKQHFDSSWLWDLFSKQGSLSFFLIARVTSAGKLKRVTSKMDEAGGLKSIARLELSLIGSCLLKNSELLNKQEKVFHRSMRVPGYWNSPVEEHDDSAHQLAKMLGTTH